MSRRRPGIASEPTPLPCHTCGRGVAYPRGGECNRCYEYRRKHGEARPAQLRYARRYCPLCGELAVRGSPFCAAHRAHVEARQQRVLAEAHLVGASDLGRLHTAAGLVPETCAWCQRAPQIADLERTAVHVAECQWCGRAFAATSGNRRKYCGDRCRNYANRVTHARRTRRPRTTRPEEQSA